MHDIRRILRAAGRRLLLVNLIDRVVWSLTIAVVLITLMIVADRSFDLGLAWQRLGLWTLGAGVAVGVVWALVFRPGEDAVARIVDERAQLREALSTALCVERDEDAWSKAVVQSAADKARRVPVRETIPIEGPRSWKLPTAMTLVLIVTVFLMPTLDLRGSRAQAKANEEDKKNLAQAKEQQQEADRMIREIMQKHNLELSDETLNPELDNDLQKPENPENIRKQAIKKLTNLTEALNKKQESEEAKSLEAMKDMMRQLRSPGRGELDEFSRQLSRGNFQKAQRELNQLTKKLGEGKLNAEQQKQVQKQMQNMAKQLNELAKQKSTIEEALKQAGLSAEQAKKLATNPEALKQALKKTQGMSEAQKKQLEQMAKALNKAGQQSQAMAQAMSEMAKGMGKEGMSQKGMQAMDAMSGQLSSMEMLSQDMQASGQAMQAAMAEMAKLGQCNGSQSWCEGNSSASGNKPWQPGNSLSQSNGSGGKGGHGHGDGPESEEADYIFRHEKANVTNKGGPIIGSRFVYGKQIKGEAREAFAAAVEVASEQAAEDITTMNVDPQYRQAVKHYFGRLDERVKAQQATGAKPAKGAADTNTTDSDAADDTGDAGNAGGDD